MALSDSDPIRYRRRASELGKLADQEQDFTEACRLLHEALSWIQIAENEEYLAIHVGAGSSNAAVLRKN